MLLTDEEKRMLEGECGLGVKRSMMLLVKVGEAFDAEKMIPVNLVHISNATPLGLVEELTEGVEKIRALCSLHAIFDPILWREKYHLVARGSILGGLGLLDEKEFSSRLDILRRLGFLPTFTCIPYASGMVVRPGDVAAWSGSSGQVFSNSVLGARAAREGSSTAIAAAVTGVTPYMGLLKKENRYAKVLIKPEDLDFDNFTAADYGALGYYVGGVARQRNAVIEGLPNNISLEQCKFLTSPLPVSGACIMCHIAGVTPEAPTLEAALGNKKPEEEVKVGKKEIKGVYEMLTTADRDDVDLVIIGCPHCTISEIGEIATLLQGKKVKEGVRFCIGTSNPIYTLAKESGFTDTIEEAGAFFTNCCVSGLNPFLYVDGARIVATNSSRGAHYIQRLPEGKTKTFYGDTKSCINAATTGKCGG